MGDWLDSSVILCNCHVAESKCFSLCLLTSLHPMSITSLSSLSALVRFEHRSHCCKANVLTTWSHAHVGSNLLSAVAFNIPVMKLCNLWEYGNIAGNILGSCFLEEFWVLLSVVVGCQGYQQISHFRAFFNFRNSPKWQWSRFS